MNSNFMTNMALNLLRGKNPQAAGMIENMMKSGKSPKDAFREFTNNGNIKPEQLNQVKGFAKQMGINIPDSEIADLQGNTQSTNSNVDRF